jgi:hypothetical protein
MAMRSWAVGKGKALPNSVGAVFGVFAITANKDQTVEIKGMIMCVRILIAAMEVV